MRRPMTLVGSCTYPPGAVTIPTVATGISAVGHVAVVGRLPDGGGQRGVGTLDDHVRADARPPAVRQDRQPLEASRLRVPVGRDLRRLPLHLRLRAHRRPAPAQREGRLVAVDGPAPRRHRRPRRRHPVAARRSGRPRATSRTSPTRSSTARSARSASGSTSSTTRDTCPNCGAKDSFTEARQFNLMFKTFAGPVEGAGHEVYLRPETAQGMFVNFSNVLNASRKKPPFGIAQIGKSFRNEITPGNFVFRTREFEQMEMEFFVPPDEAPRWYEYWCQERYRWYVELGMPESTAAPAGPRRRRAQPLLVGHLRRGVPLPLGLGRARGHRQPRRLRPHRSTPRRRGRSSSTSTRRPTSATCPTSSSRRPAPPGR